MRLACGFSFSEEQENTSAIFLKEHCLAPATAAAAAGRQNETQKYHQHACDAASSQRGCLLVVLRGAAAEAGAAQGGTVGIRAAKIECQPERLARMVSECERLFSAAKFIVFLSDTTHSKRTSLKLFEALLLLKSNKKYWNALSVSTAMRKTGDSGKEVTEEDRLGSLLSISHQCYGRTS